MASKIECIEPLRIAHTDIDFAPAVRAGSWIFLNGIEAVDYASGVHASVTGVPGLPHHGLPRNRREGDFICARFKSLLAQAGTSFANTVRLDQYYPTWKAVDPYHLARHAAFGSHIPPSTSVIVDRLLADGIDISASLLAVLPGSGREPKRAATPTLTAPMTSGYAPAVISGDFVFVAGQLPRAPDGSVDPKAHVPAHSRWGGYEIRRQTEYLIGERLVPALRAAGSSPASTVKAQVYLRHVDDTAHFLDVWNAHFGHRQCALTIVPVRDFGLVPSNIEVNLIAVIESARSHAKKVVIDGCIPAEATFGAAAVRAGDLLFCSGMMAADAGGPIAAARGLRHFGATARAQMHDIVHALGQVCSAAGTTMGNVVRILQFHTDLGEFYPMHREWQEVLAGAPVPFSAVQVPADLPIPGSSVVVDAWFYAP